MIELRLAEEFFLLALNEKTGTTALSKVEYIKYGVAAAILQELQLLQKLELAGEMVSVLDGNPLGDLLLDPALEVLEQAAKPKKVQHWVSRLGGKYKKFKTVLSNDLVAKGVLRQRGSGSDVSEPKWFRPQRFTAWEDIPLQLLRKRVYDILVHGENPDPKSLRLLGLIHGCKLTRHIFTHKEDYETAMQRIAPLTEGDLFKKAIKSTVKNNWVFAFSGVITVLAMIAKEAC